MRTRSDTVPAQMVAAYAFQAGLQIERDLQTAAEVFARGTRPWPHFAEEASGSAVRLAVGGVGGEGAAPPIRARMPGVTLSPLAQAAVAELRQHLSTGEIESLLGLSRSYLSRLGKVREPSKALVVALLLLAADPRRIEEVRRKLSG